MRAPILLCLVALAAAAPAPAQEAAPHPLDGTLWDLRAGERIGREALAERLSGADIVVLGEVHDNPRHHMAQAWLVGRLRPAGLAFEMIAEADEARIERFLAAGGEPGAIGPEIGWEDSGWPDWALYRPVLEAWRPRAYAGGGVARSTVMAAAGEGAAAHAPDARFAELLARPLPPETQHDLEAEMIAAHCGRLPPEAARGMVEVQRLRDASFAAAALRARRRSGGQVVLITGNGHARTDRGVPAYLRAAEPGLTVASVGMVETQPGVTAPAGYDLPYDHAWFTAPAERPDPCAGFR